MAKHFVAKKRDFALIRSLLLPLAFFAAVIALFNMGLSYLGKTSEREQLESARRAVVNATVQCYAMEGQFPSSVQYLKEHYGLQVNTDKYIVDYSFFAGNMMPEITVLPRFFTGDDVPREIAELGVPT